jgi:hypothetical protein
MRTEVKTLVSVLVLEVELKLSNIFYRITGPSDKMSDDVEFGSDICPMTFSSVLARK